MPGRISPGSCPAHAWSYRSFSPNSEEPLRARQQKNDEQAGGDRVLKGAAEVMRGEGGQQAQQHPAGQCTRGAAEAADSKRDKAVQRQHETECEIRKCQL